MKWDLVFLGGVACAVGGVWLIYPPAALILGGLAASGIAYVMGRPDEPPNELTEQTPIND